jgi:lipopolysaccharide biosynthesis glycosyltransferase
MPEGEIRVAYTIDVRGAGAQQFCDQLLVSVYSLLKTKSPDDRIRVSVFYGSIPYGLEQRVSSLGRDGFKVEFNRIDANLLARLDRCSGRDPTKGIRTFSGITFVRFCLPDLIPDADRVVYLDCDTLARFPIKDLWDVEFDAGSLIAATPGVVPEYGFNSGTIVLDLAGMRREGCVEPFLEYAEKEAKLFMLPDQTAMNKFFGGRITEIDGSWVFTPSVGGNSPYLRSAKMFHFYNGHKPYRITREDTGRVLVIWNNLLSEAEKEVSDAG